MEFRKMRRFKQQIPLEECKEVLQKEKRGFLAVNGEGGYPYAVPINFFFDKNTEKIYFHGATEGHKIDAVKNDDKVCFTVCEQGEQRNDWSYYARSVIVFGRIRFMKPDETATEYVRRTAYKYYPENSNEEIETDIIRHSQKMQILELTPEHITGKLVHEK